MRWPLLYLDRGATGLLSPSQEGWTFCWSPFPLPCLRGLRGMLLLPVARGKAVRLHTSGVVDFRYGYLKA
jgi:hypothetical protein